MAARSKGHVEIDSGECKGCGLCVEVCPPEVLELAPELNPYVVHPAQYKGEGCTGCGVCYYCCPEPGAVTVYKESDSAGPSNEPPVQGTKHDAKREAGHATAL